MFSSIMYSQSQTHYLHDYQDEVGQKSREVFTALVIQDMNMLIKDIDPYEEHGPDGILP